MFQGEPGRFLIELDTQQYSHLFSDVVVVGSGIAGIRAAIQAAKHVDVLIVTKSSLADGCTPHAQGGIAAAMRPDQALESHVQDTLATGHGLCDPEIVNAVVRDGPALVRELIEWGTKFDVEGSELLFTREGGHSEPRILHAHGDSTGFEIERCLEEKVRSLPNVRILENTSCLDLLTTDGDCVGIVISSRKEGVQCVWAKQTILATGGCGQVYRETTNPQVVSGDGMAAAYRAGAVLQDMEFVQFHPTVLYVAGSSRDLISEAVRGEGGILLNRHGERFMPSYHEKAELAPRDAVSQAIVKEMKRTEDTSVYLDVRHIPKKQFRARFPHIFGLCQRFGIDIAKEPIPVRPAQHYMIGGVKTDAQGATSLRNLYACGEVAATGLHGANRLASNSLLEGLVFGYRSGEAAGAAAARNPDFPRIRRFRHKPDVPKQLNLDLWDMRHSLTSEMWREVGIERDDERLRRGLGRIEHWGRYVLRTAFDTPIGWEVQNMLLVGKLIAQAALQRTESRGVHLRQDYPDKNDRDWRKHLTFKRPEGVGGQ
jgi:L-aspartate oxidase